MPLMPVQRNQLVDFTPNPAAPVPPGIGVAIGLAAATDGVRFPPGSPVVLLGSYSADPGLIRQCTGGVTAAILLTLIRTDKAWGETARLISSEARIRRPVPDEPPSLSYRERGVFSVDLTKFFEVPPERGQYHVEACLGPYTTERIRFSIV